MEVRERFWSKIHRTSTCWIWTPVTVCGYGRLTVDGVGMYAHRLAYEWEVGPIPLGLEVDHLCRIKRCVNPAHLEAVTRAENGRRSGDQNWSCYNGHSDDKIRISFTGKWANGYRECGECMDMVDLIVSQYRRPPKMRDVRV